MIQLNSFSCLKNIFLTLTLGFAKSVTLDAGSLIFSRKPPSRSLYAHSSVTLQTMHVYSFLANTCPTKRIDYCNLSLGGFYQINCFVWNRNWTEEDRTWRRCYCFALWTFPSLAYDSPLSIQPLIDCFYWLIHLFGTIATGRTARHAADKVKSSKHQSVDY